VPVTEFNQYVKSLTQLAKSNNHRYLVVLTGEETWAQQLLTETLHAENTLWLGDGLSPDCTPMAKAKSVLGREYQHVVFNGYSGFNPDAFGQSVGTIAGGGLCFIIAPALEAWSTYEDPDYLRYLASPEQQGATSANFIARMVRLIKTDGDSHVIEQDQPLPIIESATNVPLMGREYAEQAQAVEKIIKTVTGHRNRPLVITADRGRGKSSALGLAAAALLQTSLSRVTVTAPNRAALDSLFKHAMAELDGACLVKNSLVWQGKEIVFVATDQLVEQLPPCELLLIDEAAAIPTPMLTILAQHYSRVVFATTVHGYEGTGRGFSLRFVKTLEKLSPQWRSISLSQPIRWSADDPLERLSNQILGLEFEGVNNDSFDCFNPETIDFQQVTQLALANDEALLQQVFSLLVSAHYQTKPSDFRQLLDAPSLSIFIAKDNEQVIATALVLREGQFSPQMTEKVWLGQRRLRGHLLAQSLIAQVGLPEAGALSYVRIMRIAVTPSLQVRGIGRQFECWISRWAQEQGFDFIGASYGATASLTHYWLGQGYRALRLGLTKDRASGTHALLVLKSLQDKTESVAIITQATAMFSQALRYSISGEFRVLEQVLVVALLSDVVPQQTLPGTAALNIDNYISSDRPLEQVDYLLEAYIWQTPKRLLNLTEQQQRLIVSRIMQKQAWPVVVKLVDATGKKQAITALKQAVSQLWQ